MGCVPSKNTSTVHPTNSSNNSISLPEQVTNSNLQNRTILVQELPDPPTSTPEPAETTAIATEEYVTTTTKQFIKPSAAAEIQIKLQNHVSKSQNSLQQSTKPKLQRQTTITDDEEEIQPSMDDRDVGANNSNMDNSYFDDNGGSTDHTNHVPNQMVSDMSDEQCNRPSWAIERSCHRSNPTLRLYGTDSQIEFFKMLDKKIDEGPDFHEEDKRL